MRIKLKHMELEIRRRETSGAGAAAKSESGQLRGGASMGSPAARGEAAWAAGRPPCLLGGRALHPGKRGVALYSGASSWSWHLPGSALAGVGR